MTHAYLGPRFTEAQIEDALRTCKVPHQRLEDVARQTAELLAGGAVIGWFQGGMEWGPRALGARSILADPRRAEMKDLVNRCIKHREGFRPFAPAILAERAAEYVELTQPSPFMLFVHPVRPEKRDEIPAVVHVDGTTRVQTVRLEDHPLFHQLIAEFDRLTGVPVILNTSFNVNGEPIVCSPFDAIRCFFGSGLDHLVMGPFLISKGQGTVAAQPHADHLSAVS
jgi:carbamoyltransferase